MIKVGDRFWSEYFKSFGTVTKYCDDNNWWFILDGKKRELKALSTPDKLEWVNA